MNLHRWACFILCSLLAAANLIAGLDASTFVAAMFIILSTMDQHHKGGGE